MSSADFIALVFASDSRTFWNKSLALSNPHFLACEMRIKTTLGPLTCENHTHDDILHTVELWEVPLASHLPLSEVC